MEEPYLPKWATAEEAAAWLSAMTGEAWPLQRLLECGVDVGIWIDCPDDAPPERVSEVFLGRREGFFAPVCFIPDRERLAFDRDGGILSLTVRPDGRTMKIAPPLRFPASELRFPAAGVRELAAASVRPGETLPVDRRATIKVGHLSITEEDPHLGAWLNARGGLEALKGARIEVLPAQTPAAGTQPTAQAPKLTQSQVRSRSDAMAVELDVVLRQLESGSQLTAGNVMPLLKARAGKPGSCVVEEAGDGVVWRAADGRLDKMDGKALGARLRRMGKAR